MGRALSDMGWKMNRLWNDIDFLKGCIFAVCVVMIAAGIWWMP